MQQYLFHCLKIEPSNKVEDEDDVLPPPISILHIDVQTFSGKLNPEDSVVMIKSRYEEVSSPKHAVEILFDNSQERDILEAFCSYVQGKDPDILVFVGDRYANTILDYLFARAVTLGLELNISRERTHKNTVTKGNCLKLADAAKTRIMHIASPELNYDHSDKNAYSVVEFKGP